MIKMIDDICIINGSKDDVLVDLQMATLFVLEELNTLDKLILLHSLTDIINESLKGE